MADSKLPPELASVQLNLPDAQDPNDNPGASNQNGLSDWQRFVVKNFFDTQPKRRASYLKRLGYEMGKDGEEYRPLGSNGSFQPIEEENTLATAFPAIGQAFPTVSHFIPYYKLFTEEGRNELVRDARDNYFDLVIAAPTIGATSAAAAASAAPQGAAAGATIGGAAGPVGAAAGATIGGAIAGLGAAAAGAIGGNVIAETLKKGIGDYFLDENVPLDTQQLVYQSVTAGTLAAAGEGAGALYKQLKKVRAESYQKALKGASIKASNGTWNDTLATDLAKNPENYTPEAVKGANEKLLGLSDTIFGTSVENPKSTRDLTGGIARDAIQPLNKRADLEIAKLSENPEANFTVEEMVNTLKQKTDALAQKKFKTQDEERALDFFRSEVDSLKEKTRIAPPEGAGPVTDAPAYEELSFKDGRDLVKRWQNAAYEEGPVKGNPIVRQATGDLKSLTDAKAATVGSDLPAINAKRSEILNTYKNMQSVIKDGTMQAAYIGKDSLAKQRTRAMFDEMDRVLNTNLSEGAQMTQFQAAVENLYNSPSSFGSGSVFADMMREGIAGAKKGAGVGFGIGVAAGAGLPGVTSMGLGAKAALVGGAIGGAKGVRRGAQFSSPDSLINSFSKVKSTIDALNENPTIAQAALRGTVSPAAMLSTQSDQLANHFLSSPAPGVQPPLAPPPETMGDTASPAAGGQAQPSPVELPPELKDLKLNLPPD